MLSASSRCAAHGNATDKIRNEKNIFVVLLKKDIVMNGVETKIKKQSRTKRMQNTGVLEKNN